MIFDAIYEYFFTSRLGVLEFIASVMILLSVYQLAKQNIWNFLWGGIGVAIYGFIFMEVKLYADMVLQWGYFLPITFFGWWYWLRKGDDGKDTLLITTGQWYQWFFGIAMMLYVWVAVAGMFKTHTDAAFPYPDSFILVASMYAQYLLSKKFLENWLLWILIDIVAIPVYYLKGLYVTSGLYVILLCLATYGLVRWSKDWYEQQKQPHFGRNANVK